MTRAQREWLERIGAAGEIAASEIPDVTRRALHRLIMIEDCPRMYFGPRTHRVRLTGIGKTERERQAARAAR